MLRYFFITIMAAAVYSSRLPAQEITTSAPPRAAQAYPDAVPVVGPVQGDSPVIESATQSYSNKVYTLDGNVVITSGTRRVEADHVVYDSATGELALTGHLYLANTTGDEVIHASRGSYNLKSEAGSFYDVSGSIGLKVDAAEAAHRNIYTTSNPFLFTGRMLVKTGKHTYDLYDGTLTACQLPRPDWLLSSGHLAVNEEKVHASNTTFRLLNLPILFFPYVTHPLDARDRESGLLTPTIGQYDKSGTKGVVIGEQIYLVLGRSADLVVGADYYTSIGFGQNAAFRFRGSGLDFVNVRYNGLLDRRTGTGNQGGEDAIAAGRFDFTQNTHAAANIEYLSSYVYREAFSTSFNQAVTSDIISTAFITHHADGYEFSGFADRYQGIKLIAQGTTPQQQVHIFHAPAVNLTTTDHRIAGTPLEWTLDAQVAGLKRSQPNFATSGIVERVDVRPEVSLPLHFGGWNVRPEVGARETAYTRSRLPPVPGQGPVENLAGLSRADFEFKLDLRPPVLTRTFAVPGKLQNLLGTSVRHTLEPELNYRLTKGIGNFLQVLRFDETDVASDTNEVEYGVTQRLFRRSGKTRPCRLSDVGGLNPQDAVDASESIEDCKNEELISWRLTQKYFFDKNFGGAINTGRRNIFETTLNFSGVAFLTEPREISPLLSRLRVRTSAATDVEWDFDLDTGARKFTSSNFFVDYHHGNAFTALSYARLDAPGRFYTQGASDTTTATGVTSQVSDFNQLRYLIGYGNPLKPGLSLAANTGLDLKSLYGTTSTTTSASGVVSSTTVYPALFQYAAVQGSYNWNCCGVSIEYRKFELGSVRNENSYRFNFTLANIGSAGNLRKAERLF